MTKVRFKPLSRRRRILVEMDVEEFIALKDSMVVIDLPGNHYFSAVATLATFNDFERTSLYVGRNNGNTSKNDKRRPQSSKTSRYSGVDSQAPVFVDPFNVVDVTTPEPYYNDGNSADSSYSSDSGSASSGGDSSW